MTHRRVDRLFLGVLPHPYIHFDELVADEEPTEKRSSGRFKGSQGQCVPMCPTAYDAQSFLYPLESRNVLLIICILLTTDEISYR